jgi:hypothetical protein
MDRIVLVRSYRRGHAVEHAATSCGCLSSEARLTRRHEGSETIDETCERTAVVGRVVLRV